MHLDQPPSRRGLLTRQQPRRHHQVRPVRQPVPSDQEELRRRVQLVVHPPQRPDRLSIPAVRRTVVFPRFATLEQRRPGSSQLRMPIPDHRFKAHTLQLERPTPPQQLVPVAPVPNEIAPVLFALQHDRPRPLHRQGVGSRSLNESLALRCNAQRTRLRVVPRRIDPVPRARAPNLFRRGAEPTLHEQRDRQPLQRQVRIRLHKRAESTAKDSGEVGYCLGMLPVVLSPYELHARSVCASVALLLGRPAVTLLPTPLEGRDRATVGRAMMESPGFERLVEKWRWSGVLWRQGSLTGDIGGVSPIEYIQQAAETIVSAGERDERSPSARLAALVRETRFADTSPYLDAVSRDLERGGGDPSVSVPVSVGLERYASAIGAPVCVSGGGPGSGSLVGRLERRGERILARFTTTFVHGASGTLIDEIRDDIGEELDAVRSALRLAVASREQRESTDHLDAAAADLGRAVDRLPDEMLAPAEDDELRVRGGVRRVPVVVQVAAAPADDALRSAARAAEMLADGRGVRGGRRRHASTREHAPRTNTTQGGAIVAGEVIRLRVRELPFDSPNHASTT